MTEASDTALRDVVLKRLDADTKPADEWSALVLAALEGPDQLARLLDEGSQEAAKTKLPQAPQPRPESPSSAASPSKASAASARRRRSTSRPAPASRSSSAATARASRASPWHK